MASIKKSVESLKGVSHSAAKGVTDTAGKERPQAQHTGSAECHFNTHSLIVLVVLRKGSQGAVRFYDTFRTV